jgi:hypothetical protein
MGARPKEGTACRSGPELAVLGVSDPARLGPYLERRRYAQAR